jgi:hypothetical protein
VARPRLSIRYHPCLVNGVVDASGKATGIQDFSAEWNSIKPSQHPKKRLARENVDDQIFGAQGFAPQILVRIRFISFVFLTGNRSSAGSVRVACDICAIYCLLLFLHLCQSPLGSRLTTGFMQK